mmetsp:Transcript_18753/g.40361  ORF Transcript_18753/g.40361 Transcript_18753/m.40361 type:complete len:235 (-) Transcript_18753:300-1004(-)
MNRKRDFIYRYRTVNSGAFNHSGDLTTMIRTVGKVLPFTNKHSLSFARGRRHVFGPSTVLVRSGVKVLHGRNVCVHRIPIRQALTELVELLFCKVLHWNLFVGLSCSKCMKVLEHSKVVAIGIAFFDETNPGEPWTLPLVPVPWHSLSFRQQNRLVSWLERRIVPRNILLSDPLFINDWIVLIVSTVESHFRGIDKVSLQQAENHMSLQGKCIMCGVERVGRVGQVEKEVGPFE